jgi:hypothetical protein
MPDANDRYPGRRTVLKATGALSTLGVTTGLVSAGGGASAEDHHHDSNDGNELKAPTPAEPEVDLGEKASVRFEDQVTDGTYIVARDVVVPTAGFLSIHELVAENPGGEVFDYVAEDGGPQNAAQTIIGYSEYLAVGVYDRVVVDIFEDEELLPVSDDRDRLEEPQVLLALMHTDGNGNGEWDLFDNEDIQDAAYDFGTTDLAPPYDRPSDVAPVIPLEKNAEEFDIFVEHGETEVNDNESD